MKKIAACLLACLLLCFCAQAEGGLEIVQQLYVPMEDFGGYVGYIFAEITNTGDETLGFDWAVCTILDEEGNALSEYEAFLCYPSTIGPGETAFFADYQYVQGVSGPDEMPGCSLELLTGEPFYDAPVELTVLSAECAEVVDNWGDQVYKLMVKVKNETETPISDPTLTYGIYDENGVLIYAGATTVYYSMLPAGEEAYYCLDIDYAFDQYWRLSGVQPAGVKLRAVVE